MLNSRLFETVLSKVAALPHFERLGVSLLVGGPLLVCGFISYFVSAFFVVPLWLLIFFRPDWLVPLFLIGPVTSVFVLYFHTRFVFWRRNEMRSWSRRALFLFILRYVGRFALFGHTVGLVSAIVSIVLRVNAFEHVGEIATGFGPRFFDGTVEKALFGDDAESAA